MRKHLTYANVMATLAFLIAVAGGTAYAANTIFSTDIVNGEVKTVDLANGAVNNAKLADASVDSDAVADDSLGSRDLRNNAAVQSPDVRNESLSGADIAAESITGGDIADGTVTGDDVTEETLWSGNILDNSIHGVDIWNETLSGSDVAADSLGGADVNESSLSTVPRAGVAALGGLGRSSSGGCDPESANYVDCAIVTLNLLQPARVLLIGQVWAQREADANEGHGSCELVSNAGRILPNTEVFITTDDLGESVGLTAVTGVQTAGSHDYAVDCDQSSLGAITYRNVSISAVALSPD